MGGAAAIVLAGANGVQQPSQANEEYDNTLGNDQVKDVRQGLKTLLK